MAGDWIKFEKTTPDKPEVFEIGGILGIDPDAVVGKLLRIWNWFDDHSKDGHAHVTVMSLLDRYAGVTGFVTAMEKVGWLVVDGDTMSIPNFFRHNGEPAKVRALAKNRKQNQRVKCHAESHGANVTKTGPEKRREEKSNIPPNPQGEDDGGREAPKRQKFQAPTISEVEAYGKTLTPPFVRAFEFVNFYESKGWMVGKAPMKSWQAAVRTWHTKDMPAPTAQRKITFTDTWTK